MQGHRKTAGRGDQRHQAFQAHGLFRGGIGLVAETFGGEQLARHHKAGSLARVSQVRSPARVDRVDDRLVDTYSERAAHLREPRVAGVPVPGNHEVHNLLLSVGQRPGRQRGPQVLASLEQFRQSDIGRVWPAHDSAGCLGCVVDARLFGVHVGAVQNCYAWHASPQSEFVLRARGYHRLAKRASRKSEMARCINPSETCIRRLCGKRPLNPRSAAAAW
jgi:hypothetical protein